MSYPFLSNAWFDEVARLREEAGDIDIPDSFLSVRINIEVTQGPEGETVESHLGQGSWIRGFQDAEATIRLPYPVARKIFVERDSSAAMQAFMTGLIKVEGDVTRIMSLQRPTTPPSQEAVELIGRIIAMTT